MSHDPDTTETGIDLAALERGDEAAWEDFFADYRPVVRGVVSWPKWNFSPDVRDDLEQDICAELTRSVFQFQERSSLRYYIKRVAVNRCIDRIRRQVRDREIFTSTTYTTPDGEARELTLAGPEQYDPVRRIVILEQVEALKRLLAELDETCRTAIRLFYAESLSYKEIAVKLSISINTVGSRLAKCLEKLRQTARMDPSLGDEIAVPGDGEGKKTVKTLN